MPSIAQAQPSSRTTLYTPRGSTRQYPVGVLPLAPGSGRLLFSPAVDTDENSSTNPVNAAPVIAVLDELGGEITLAVQVDPVADVPVTFELWSTNGVSVTRTAQADSWGAAWTRIVVRDIGGSFSYRASAPGFRETEVRRFHFEPSQIGFSVQVGEAALTAEPLPNGQALITLRSPVPLKPGRDAPELLITRIPDDTTGDAEAHPLNSVLRALADDGIGLPLPRVSLQIESEYIAQVELRLPVGSYRLLGSLDINSDQMQYHISDPIAYKQTEASDFRPNRATWVSKLDFTTGMALVRYATLPGKAAFDLVPRMEVPAVNVPEENNNVLIKGWRTGPFQMQREINQVSVEQRRGVSSMTVNLKDIHYDPLNRTYSLLLESSIATEVDAVIEVLGQGGAVINTEARRVRVSPEQADIQNVDVPTELGRPTGMRLTLGEYETLISITTLDSGPLVIAAPQSEAGEDSLDLYTKSLIAAANVLSAITPDLIYFEYKYYIKILEVELVTRSCKVPGGCEPVKIESKNLSRLKNAIWDIWSDGAAAILSGGVELNLTLKYNFTVDISACATQEDIDKVKEWVRALAVDLNAILEKIKKGKDGSSDRRQLDTSKLPFPWLPVIMWWASGEIGIKALADVEDGDLTISLGGAGFIDGAINFGWGVPWFSDYEKQWKALWWIIEGLHTASEAYRIIDVITQTNSKAFFKCPLERPDPPIKPDKPNADDRQDVWQEVANNVRGRGDVRSIDDLHLLIHRAAQMGLPRAEKLFTLYLREAELSQFATNSSSRQQFYGESHAILAQGTQDIANMISGTLPITPGLLLTEALMIRGSKAVSDVWALPYTQVQDTLLYASIEAKNAMQQFYGEELALQDELRQLFMNGTVGVLANGFADATMLSLQRAGLPYQLISIWEGISDFGGEFAPYVSPADAPRVLVAPTSSLYNLNSYIGVREWLEAYVSGGGLLIVFTQPFGEDWRVLPGGELRGVGYEEDLKCEQESVRAASPSKWLTFMGEPTPDVTVDGVFTSWPRNANLLLLRTSGTYPGYPAMLEYTYGAGRVVATSSYGDFAVYQAMWWGDDWSFTRSLLIRGYLLSTGQDIEDVQTVAPDTQFTTTISMTNYSSFAVNNTRVMLPRNFSRWGSEYGETVNVTNTIQPGATAGFTVSMRTPPVYRGVHNWTQVGLFHIDTQHNTDFGSFTLPGPFVLVPSPNAPVRVSLTFHADRVAARPYETVQVTATVRNHTALSQTVVIRASISNVPTAPITVSLAPSATAYHTYALYLDRSRHIKANLTTITTTVLFQGALDVNMGYSNLLPTIILPPAIRSGTHISALIVNKPGYLRPSATSVTATLLMTLFDPSGGVRWTGQVTAPPLAQSEFVVRSVAVGSIGAAEIGDFELRYQLDSWGGYQPYMRVTIPARPTLLAAFDRPSYNARNTVYFTATALNQSRFDLNPTITVTFAAGNLTKTQNVALPVGAQASVPLSFTLAPTFTGGSYVVGIKAGQVGEVERNAGFVGPLSYITLDTPERTYQAGDTVVVTIANTGGVDTTAWYGISFIGTYRTPSVWYPLRRNLTDTQGTVSLQADSSLTRSIVIPAQAATDRYWLQVFATDNNTRHAASVSRDVTIFGISGQLDAYTDEVVGGGELRGANAVDPVYHVGDTVKATVIVTGDPAPLDGTLALRVTRAQSATTEIGAQSKVNLDEELGFGSRTTPATYVGITGTVYVMWSEERSNPPNGFLYFKYRHPGGEWSAIEQLPGVSNWQRLDPHFVVDITGTVHLLWTEGQQGNGLTVLYARRLVTGTWTTSTRVGALYSSLQSELGIDGAGNIYAVWAEGVPYNVRFSYLPVGSSTWVTPTTVNTVGTANQANPDLFVTPDGLVYITWEDNRSGTANYDIYAMMRSITGTIIPEARVHAALSTHQRYPSIAVRPDGTILVVWQDARNHSSNTDIYGAYYAAGAWQPDTRIDDLPGPQSFPRVATDGAGKVELAWRDNSASNLMASAHVTAGTWLSGVVAGQTDEAPHLTMNPSGAGSLIVDFKNDIYQRYYISPAVWVTPTLVHSPTGGATQYYADVTVDSSNNAWISWWDAQGGVSTGVDMYQRVRTAAGALLTETRVNSITGAILSSGYTDLAVDPDGNAWAIWTYTQSGQLDVYVAYKPVTSTVWINEERVHSASAYNQQRPSIAVDAQGRAYAIWFDDTGLPNQHKLLFSTRMPNSSWSIPEMVNSVYRSALTTYRNASLAVDPAGNTYAVWTDGRNGNPDIYFAHRPAGGQWSVNERVNDDAGTADQRDPTIGIDGAGNAYVAWGDSRGQYPEIYFATRQPGGAWSSNVKIGSAVVNYNGQYPYARYPSIAVNLQGDIHTSWYSYYRYGTVINNDYYVVRWRTRPAGSTWGPETSLVVDTGPRPWVPTTGVDANGKGFVVYAYNAYDGDSVADDDIYLRVITSTGTQSLVWSKMVSVTANPVQSVDEEIGTLNEQPGKYRLEVDLISPLSQTLAAVQYPFYLQFITRELTLNLDRAIYSAGQTVSVTGYLTNTSGSAGSLPLLVTAGNTTLINTSHALADGQGIAFSALFNIAQTTHVRAASAESVVEQTAILLSGEEAQLNAPDVAGVSLFSATASLYNPTQVTLNAQVTIAGGAAQPISVPPNSVGGIARSLSITQTTPIVAVFSGDFNATLTRTVLWGEAGKVKLLKPPEDLYAGGASFGYVVTGTGSIPSKAHLRWSVDATPLVSPSISLWEAQVTTGTQLITLTPGLHSILVELLDLNQTVMATSSVTVTVLPIVGPSEAIVRITNVAVQPASIGKTFNVTLTVANDGPAIMTIVSLLAFESPRQWLITPTAYLTQTFAFSMATPINTPTGVYPGEARIGDAVRPFTITTTGTKVALALGLDKAFYQPQEPAKLAITLTEQANRSSRYHLSFRYLDAESFITVTVNANQVVTYSYPFTATETDRVSVMLSYTPTNTSIQSQRTVMIDSLPVSVVDDRPGVYVVLNKSGVYTAGEVITLSVVVSTPVSGVTLFGPNERIGQDGDSFMWTAPILTPTGAGQFARSAGNSAEQSEFVIPQTITGTHIVTYALPSSLRTARYNFNLLVDGEIHNVPVDVRGWTMYGRKLHLDRPTYKLADTFTATVEFVNLGAPIPNAHMNAVIWAPDNSAITISPQISQNITVPSGLSYHVVTGVFSSTQVGAHMLVVGLSRDGESITTASALFSAGKARLASVRTDRSYYAPSQPGYAMLDAAGRGATALIVSATAPLAAPVVIFSTTADLDGFTTFTFSVPTTAVGDYFLSTLSVDADGNRSVRSHTYIVRGLRDTHAPSLTLTYPNTDTFITTSGFSTTILVQGTAVDTSTVQVSVNGLVVTPTLGGQFSATLVVEQGLNLVAVSAIDAWGNYTYTPMIPVVVRPNYGVQWSAFSSPLGAAGPVTFRAVITASNAMGGLNLLLVMPPSLLNSPQISSSAGLGEIAYSPDSLYANWYGTVDQTQAVTITITATPVSTGIVTATGVVQWGWGIMNEQSLMVQVSTGNTYYVYLPQVMR